MKNHIFLILAGINIINASDNNKPLDIPLNSNVIPDADNTNANSKFIPSNMGANTSNAQTNLTYNNHTDYSQ